MQVEIDATRPTTSNLSFNLGQVLARNRVNARAGSALLVRQAQKLAPAQSKIPNPAPA